MYYEIYQYTFVIILVVLLLFKKIDGLGFVILLVPYEFSVNLGSNVKFYQLALVAFTIYNFFRYRRFGFHNIQLNYYLLYVSISAFIISSFFIDYIGVLKGNFFRQEGKYIQQVILLLIKFLFFALVPFYIKRFKDIFKYLKIYFYGILIICLVSLVQYVYGSISGTDIFLNPKFEYDILDQGLQEGIRLLRFGGPLGGEPKAFSVVVVFAFLAYYTCYKFGLVFFKFDLLILPLFLLCGLFISLSSTGMILAPLFIILIELYLVFQKGILLSLKKFLIIFGVVVLFLLASDYITKIYDLRVASRENFTEGNYGLEDFDFVVFTFLKSNPGWGVFGSGVGNIHNLVQPFIPEKFDYMFNTNLSANAPMLRILSETGFVGLFFYFLIFWYIWKNLRNRGYSSMYKQFFICLLFVTFLFHMIRSWNDITFFLFALLNVYSKPFMERIYLRDLKKQLK